MRLIKKRVLLYKSHCMRSSHYRSNTQTVNMARCKLSLGNDRYVEVKEWKGELRVDLRERKDHKPTKKGISLTLIRWNNLVDYLEYMDQAKAEKRKHYKSHLGGNVYLVELKHASPEDRITMLQTITPGQMACI